MTHGVVPQTVTPASGRGPRPRNIPESYRAKQAAGRRGEMPRGAATTVKGRKG